MIMPIIARIELIIIYKYEIVALSERKRKRYVRGKSRLLLVSKNVLPRMTRRKFFLHNVI